MKKVLTIVWVLASVQAMSQEAIQGFKSLRYDDDPTYLRNDTAKSWYKKFKYVPLGANPASWLSFGGEFRYQVQYFRNEEWGDVPERSYSAYYYRTFLHADLHLGKTIRFFGQLNSNTAVGRPTGNRPIDEDRADIHQAFLDINLLNEPRKKLTVRTGRQEFLYGSQRLISVREGPNNRLAFDAVKVFYKKQNLQVDAFYAAPLRTKAGPFDNPLNHNERLWSGYAVLNKVPVAGNLDLYYIGYWNRLKAYYAGEAEEKRHSIGTRIWSGAHAFKWDLEALYQFGSFGQQDIRAYTASANLHYAFEKAALSPNMGLKTEIISGDKAASDGKLNTFNPLFPRGAYFGLAALIGPVNLLDVHPSLELQLSPSLSFMSEYDVFWRLQKGDGVYGPNVAVIYPPAGNQKLIGHQFGINFEYSPTEQVSIVPEATYFIPTDYLKIVSPGRNVFFAALTVQFKY